jgi:hypothetical protein
MARRKKGEIVNPEVGEQPEAETQPEGQGEPIEAAEPESEGPVEEGAEEAQPDAPEPEQDVESVADPGDTTKIVNDSLTLRVRLTDEEIVHYSDAMIEAMDEAKRARAKAEERPVECEQIHNFTRGMVYTRRLDTGEIVSRRKMSPWERQSDIEEIVPGEAEPEAEAATEAQVESGEEHESPEGDADEVDGESDVTELEEAGIEG